ncbi:amidohydrolase [Kurthia sp. 3B1D]|uniref:Amidohydrolase n=1 Tax=Candidatus Kurthia intestinigallinarum TaxID=1562256 RepID=A0A433RXS6_9BACL|nr:amidohydrolase [Kurthia sp. 3B1D]RUS58059.1 amidohydrolase [Kurthia sp. 3B1D]
MSKQQLFDAMTASQHQFASIAKDIWDHPQLGYSERYASTLQQQTLKEAGFRVSANIGEVETAFVAECSSGSPIIGILGEFDALPGLSQAVSPTLEPLEKDAPGHGCGHNLLGTAGLEAVIALKKYMEEHHIEGTLRYYGCSAEELLSGKTFMARAGVFDDLDLVYTWHPGTFNMTTNLSMQALSSVEFFFHGRTAHAAAAPHLGRSALDAVELTNVGANYLREHVPDGSRIHYQITNGGLAPNVVPDNASVLYFLRGKNRAEVDDLLRRLHLVAEGAAMMTETTVTAEIKAGCYDTLPNLTLNEVMYDNAQLLPDISYTAEEQAFARTLQQNIDPSVVAGSKASMAQMGFQETTDLAQGFQHIPQMFRIPMPGSSDIGDVSWITPMGQIMTTCAPSAVQLHTWQATASFGSSIGMKGMHLAAQIMAGAALDSFTNPDIIQKAREEFDRNRAGITYKPAIPDDVKPPQPVA